MNNYELVLVMDPDLDADGRKKLIDQTEKLVAVAKGKLGKPDEWGKKELAYPINKKSLGYYFLYPLEMEPAQVGGFDRKLKNLDGIMRYLLVVKKVVGKESKQNGAAITK